MIMVDDNERDETTYKISSDVACLFRYKVFGLRVSHDIQELIPHLQEEIRPKSHDQAIEDLDVPILVRVNEFSEDEKIDDQSQHICWICGEPLDCTC